MHHACYISVPTANAVAVCLEADGIQIPFRGGPVAVPFPLSGQAAELPWLREHVETELVSFGEEVAQADPRLAAFGKAFRFEQLFPPSEDA